MRSFILAALILCTVCLEFSQVNLTIPQLFGDRTTSMFDLWSVEHLTGGYILGRLLAQFRRYDPYMQSGKEVLDLAYAWEICECLMESHSTPSTRTWLAGTEHWTNRLVSDPWLFSLGAFYGRHTPGKLQLALPVSMYVLWYCWNLAQPTCMTIQHQLLSPF